MPASGAALEASGKAAPLLYSNSSLAPDPALWPLTDIFALPSGLPLANVFSVGDILIGLGVALAIVLAMRRPAVPAPAATPEAVMTVEPAGTLEPAAALERAATAPGGGAAAH
jgi:hypothetical protein